MDDPHCSCKLTPQLQGGTVEELFEARIHTLFMVSAQHAPLLVSHRVVCGRRWRIWLRCCVQRCVCAVLLCVSCAAAACVVYLCVCVWRYFSSSSSLPFAAFPRCCVHFLCRFVRWRRLWRQQPQPNEMAYRQLRQGCTISSAFSCPPPPAGGDDQSGRASELAACAYTAVFTSNCLATSGTNYHRHSRNQTRWHAGL